MKRKLILATVLFICNATTWAQVDPHFSQYYAYPMWLNPALTGSENVDYRVTAIYRNQWTNIAQGFKTIGVAADFQSQGNLHFGLNVLQQSAGNGGYRYYNAQASIAYTGLKFGAEGNHRIAFALQPGLIGRRFDQTSFKGGDQWVPIIGYNPSIPTSEILVANSSTVFDIGAGLAYYNTLEEAKTSVFGGVSVAHLTQPTDPFIVRGEKSKLPMRFSIHAGAKFTLSEVLYFVPNALYMQQGSATEIMLGGYFQMLAGETTHLLVGGKYRMRDAISPSVGLVMDNKLMIGLNYDINSSELGKMVRGSNAFEISITLLGQKRGLDIYKCPKF